MKRPSLIVKLVVAGVLGSAPFAVSSAMPAAGPTTAETAAVTAGASAPGADGAEGAEGTGAGTGAAGTAGGGASGGAPGAHGATGTRSVARERPRAGSGGDARAGTNRDPDTAPAGTRTRPLDGPTGTGTRSGTTLATGPDPAAPPKQGRSLIAPRPLQGDAWVGTWTAMPQLTEPSNMPPAPFTQDGLVFADSTVRTTVHVTVGGQKMRLRLSNEFGGAPLPVTAASVALPVDGKAGVAGIVPGTSRKVTFSGHDSITVQTGAQMISDPLDFDVKQGGNLTVTLYLASGQASNNITSHPGSRTTSYMVSGDHTDDADLPGATTADHWYFLDGVDVQSDAATGATVVLGDSLTDGRGSTTNGNDRWPDQLWARLQTTHSTAGTAMLNEAAGGNAILSGGLGPTTLSRFDRDVLGNNGVDKLIIFEGVNDIGTAPATQAASQQVADDLITAYDQMITRAHSHGIEVYGATITPFGGNTYDDPAGFHEAARQTVNNWIRTSGEFDAVVDFDKAAADPTNPRQLNPDFLFEGDHLHMNPLGYGALAGAFPLELFK